MTYTPKPGELEEMGFMKYSNGGLFIRMGQGIYCKEILFKDGKWFFGNTESIYRELYPRSKEHLEQIILAFTKPE